jgi:hypothetical protein
MAIVENINYFSTIGFATAIGGAAEGWKSNERLTDCTTRREVGVSRRVLHLEIGETCLSAAKGSASNRSTIGLIHRGGTLAGTARDFAVDSSATPGACHPGNGCHSSNRLPSGSVAQAKRP